MYPSYNGYNPITHTHTHIYIYIYTHKFGNVSKLFTLLHLGSPVSIFFRDDFFLFKI
jgi:hypothetical protein